jgi:hypothetical protein
MWDSSDPSLQEAVERRPKKDIAFMFQRIENILKAKSGITGQAPVNPNRRD